MGRAGLFLLPLPGPMGPAVWHIDFVHATCGARRCPARRWARGSSRLRRQKRCQQPAFFFCSASVFLGKGMASGSFVYKGVVGVGVMLTVLLCARRGGRAEEV